MHGGSSSCPFGALILSGGGVGHELGADICEYRSQEGGVASHVLLGGCPTDTSCCKQVVFLAASLLFRSSNLSRRVPKHTSVFSQTVRGS